MRFCYFAEKIFPHGLVFSFSTLIFFSLTCLVKIELITFHFSYVNECCMSIIVLFFLIAFMCNFISDTWNWDGDGYTIQKDTDIGECYVV